MTKIVLLALMWLLAATRLTQETVYTVLVELHPNGQLVMTIPEMESLVPGWPEDLGRTIFLSQRD